MTFETVDRKTVSYTHLAVYKRQDGERILGDYEEGVMADFKLSEEDIEFLGSHELVVSGIWGMRENDLEKIKACGTRIAFDFATKYESPVIDIAIPFVDYAFFAYDGEDEEWMRNFMEEMQKKGAKTVIVTRGTKGSIAYDGTSYTEFGIIPVSYTHLTLLIRIPCRLLMNIKLPGKVNAK